MQTNSHRALDAIIVGAGWAGMYMLLKLRDHLGLSAKVLEAGDNVGGTWYWNRYPGSRCDAPSLQYSYSFSSELEQEWTWSERYASQAEIEEYANHVADRFDLRRDIEFGKRVASAEYDASERLWSIITHDGSRLSAKYCIMATGGYSVPVKPNIEGIELFEGEIYFTANWPRHEVNFDGKRVGVIGTGSSGMQTITAVAGEPLRHLYVFQRTPNYAVPARNAPIDPVYDSEFKKDYPIHREEARRSPAGTIFEGPSPTTVSSLTDEEFESRMQDALRVGGPATYSWINDLLTDRRSNERVANYLRSEVRRRVDDPEVAELLCPPKRYLVGARRLLVEPGYFEVFNQSNTTLVDVKSDPVAEIYPKGLRTSKANYELDVIILATGFDSGTGALTRIDVRGEEGQKLSDKWKHGPVTYLGLMASGFPNLFMITGPLSPAIRSNVMVSIEQHVEWTADFISYLEDNGIQAVQPTTSAEKEWTQHASDLVATTLLIEERDNQFFGANVEGKPNAYTAYIGGVGNYRVICDNVRKRGYEGFAMTGADGRTVITSPHWSGISMDSMTEPRSDAIVIL